MERILYTHSSGFRLSFDRGRFDDWCVFLTRADGVRYAPTDAAYFGRLRILAQQHGAEKIYEDFCTVYACTDSQIRPEVFALITELAAGYAKDATEVAMWLAVIYAGMVAEENKERAVLRKRIKRLGMHQVLQEGMAPEEAARFSRGKGWRELDALMRERDF